MNQNRRNIHKREPVVEPGEYSNAETKLLLLADSVLMLGRLLRAEIDHSLQQIPALLTILLLRIPLLILLWLSLTVFISYLGYLASDRVWAGLLCFLLLQVLVCFSLQLRYQRMWNDLSLPETRKNLKAYYAAFTRAGEQEHES